MRQGFDGVILVFPSFGETIGLGVIINQLIDTSFS